MNYLAIAQRLVQETNIANTGPSTVIDQKGEMANSVNWVADAYMELQNKLLWRWLRERFTLNTAAGVDTYAPLVAISEDTGQIIDRFKRWRINDVRNQPRCYLATGNIRNASRLSYLSWDDFRDIYTTQQSTDSQPSHITIDPQDNIVLGPTPNAEYVIVGEYHKSAQTLVENTDIPEMPNDYHMLLVYLAMEDKGFFDSAGEIIARAQKKQNTLMRQLIAEQGPVIRQAGPLA